jgi:hypothetical protein
VIRRAAELSLSAADDAADELTEDEVVRIASELGLPSQHVRQALHERPTLQVAPGWQDRWFDPPVLALGRTVPGPADAVQGALEQYLTTYEYLQVVRRRGPDLALVPADDAISRIARVIARPGRRFGLAHAQRVVLAVQPLPEQGAHVRIEADFRDERGRNVQSALLLGATIGLLAGSGLMAIAITATSGPLEPVLAAGGMSRAWREPRSMVKTEARRFRRTRARPARAAASTAPNRPATGPAARRGGETCRRSCLAHAVKPLHRGGSLKRRGRWNHAGDAEGRRARLRADGERDRGSRCPRGS